MGFFKKSKEQKLREAKRKRKRDKINAYKKLQEKMAGDEYKASDKKGKRGREIRRDSFNKQRRKSGTIAAKGMPDIAGDIKALGDPVLGKFGTLQTKYKRRKDAEAAGVKFRAKGGMINSKSIAKKYFKGGMV